MNKTLWNPVPTQERTVPALLNSEFLRLANKYTDCLPNLRSSKTLLIGSDYSGESFNAGYLVFSFLLTTLESWENWDTQRSKIRSEYLRELRRMSFKGLNDGQRRRALMPLLTAANNLHGLSFSVAFNKQCESVFSKQPPLDLSNPEFAAFRKWKAPILDKAFFTVHILGVLLAGLAAPGQNVMWFTDVDNIAANDERVRDLTNLFAWIISQYLTHNLGHCRCGTSKCDNGSLQIEDFLAIPDIIAGALAEQMRLRRNESKELSDVFWIHRGDFSEKTREITWWFSHCRSPLKRLFCIIDPTADGRNHLLSWFHFHNQK